MLNQNYTTAVLLFFSFSVMQNPVLGASAHRHSVKPYIVPTLAVISIAGWGVWKYFGNKKAHSDKHKSLPREEQAKEARNEIVPKIVPSASHDNSAKDSPQSTIESSPSVSGRGYVVGYEDEVLLKAIDPSNPLPLHVSLSASIVKYLSEKHGHTAKGDQQDLRRSWESEQETLSRLERHALYEPWLGEKGFYAHCAKQLACKKPDTFDRTKLVSRKLRPLGVDNYVALELYDNFMPQHALSVETWYLIAYSLRTALKDCANLEEEADRQCTRAI